MLINKLPGRRQFRLSTLLLGIAALSVTLAVTFAIGPLLIDDWKFVSGYLHVHLTPAAQHLFFDPPAPMGPMHETKVIGRRDLASAVAAVLLMAATMALTWCRLRKG